MNPTFEVRGESSPKSLLPPFPPLSTNPVIHFLDALEQLDVSNNLISKYGDTFALARTADQVESAIKHGKIASLFGLEGAHMLGNSLGGKSVVVLKKGSDKDSKN